MKSISLVVPCYNEENYILKFLESLTPFPDNYEIIISDGGSSDATLDIINSFIESRQLQNRIHVCQNINKLQSYGVNIAANYSSSDFLVRLDAHALVGDRETFLGPLISQ